MKLVCSTIVSFPFRQSFATVERYCGRRQQRKLVANLRGIAHQVYGLWGIVNAAMDDR